MLRAADLDRAAAMAYRVLIAQRVTALPVDPLFLLRKCRGTVVWTYSEVAESLAMTSMEFERRFGTADAFTISQGDRFIICYREGGNPARLRFTLAHELGHRVLGHTGGNSADEREADVFASHLLCPRPVIARLADCIRPLAAEEIARVCYVSLRCAQALAWQPDAAIPEELYRGTDELLAKATETSVGYVPKTSERFGYAAL